MLAVTSKKNRLTGSQIVVVDNRSKIWMDDDQNWYTLCDTHGSLVGHETRKLAEYHAVVPEWCEECAAIISPPVCKLGQCVLPVMSNGLCYAHRHFHARIERDGLDSIKTL